MRLYVCSTNANNSCYLKLLVYVAECSVSIQQRLTGLEDQPCCILIALFVSFTRFLDSQELELYVQLMPTFVWSILHNISSMCSVSNKFVNSNYNNINSDNRKVTKS